MSQKILMFGLIASLVTLSGCGKNNGQESDAGDTTGVDAVVDGSDGDADVAVADAEEEMDSQMPDGGEMDTNVGLADVRTCPKTHNKVGWTAELKTKFHNVGGTAKIVNDCTVAIENFTFDGKGIKVQIYGAATHGEYASGYVMSGDLTRPKAYEGERLLVNLPMGKTLDDLGGVSVWCVDAKVDFGSGKFTAP